MRARAFPGEDPATLKTPARAARALLKRDSRAGSWLEVSDFEKRVQRGCEVRPLARTVF